MEKSSLHGADNAHAHEYEGPEGPCVDRHIDVAVDRTVVNKLSLASTGVIVSGCLPVLRSLIRPYMGSIVDRIISDTCLNIDTT